MTKLVRLKGRAGLAKIANTSSCVALAATT